MEEAISKQGLLFLQQQRFGKKWKRVWCILFRETSCSISRLELFDFKDLGTLEKTDKALRKQQDNKKVIRLSDCIRVSEVDMDGCPKDCGPFLMETTDKLYVFAAERDHLEDWTQKLCEIAFPMNWGDHGPVRSALQKSPTCEEGMEDNSLYSGRETVRDFRVCVRRSEAADRCRLRGVCVLRTDVQSLLLLDQRSGEVLFSWPYRFLRRFGRDKSTFSFEAGRRCESGEGSFEFDTKQGNTLFHAVELAISLQRAAPRCHGSPDTPTPQPRTLPRPQPQVAGDLYSLVTDVPGIQNQMPASPTQAYKRPPQLSRLEAPVDKALTGVKSLTLDTRGLPLRKNQVKTISSCPLPHSSSTDTDSAPRRDADPAPRHNADSAPTERTERGEKRGEERKGRLSPCVGATPGPAHPQEPEYSLPFDSIAKNIMSDMLASHQALQPRQELPDPLYDSIDESKINSAFRGGAEAPKLTYSKTEHIYDEPEGCAAIGQDTKRPAPTLYDDPEEVKGQAWRILGSEVDPEGCEYPYNPQVDDYAVPKPPIRAFPANTNTTEEDSPYDNVSVKTAN